MDNTTNHNEIAFAIIVCSILFLLLAVLISLLAHIYQKRKQIHTREILLLKNNFQKELLQAQIEMQEQTLKTISQEIHDNIGQQLSNSKFILNTIQTTQDRVLDDKLNDCKKNISQAIQDLRDLAKSINSDAIEQQGLVNAIKNELEVIEKIGINANIETAGDIVKLNPQIELLLFRIIQESLTNAIKHAKATTLKVNLNFTFNTLEIIIEDNGIGFDINEINSKPKGIGLINIQNRCKVINAVFGIESLFHKGTQIKITINNL